MVDKEAEPTHSNNISTSLLFPNVLYWNLWLAGFLISSMNPKTRLRWNDIFCCPQACLLWTMLFKCSFVEEFTQTQSFCWYFKRWLCLLWRYITRKCSTQQQVMLIENDFWGKSKALTPHHWAGFTDLPQSILYDSDQLSSTNRLIPNLSMQMAQRVGETARRQQKKSRVVAYSFPLFSIFCFSAH